MKFPQIKKQKGFTLIEILVALAILAILAILAATAFDGSRSKAQTMIGLARNVSDGAIRFKSDTGCYPNKPVALFDATLGPAAANNYCNRDLGTTWASAYLSQYPLADATAGTLKIDKVSAGVAVSMGKDIVGTTKQYYVRFSNVPKDVIKQALVECNNSDTAVGTFPASRCRADDVTTDAVGTFDMLFDVAK